MQDNAISISVRSVEIFIVLEGGVTVDENPENSFSCEMGDAFVAFDGARVALRASKDAILYRAAVPVSV